MRAFCTVWLLIGLVGCSDDTAVPKKFLQPTKMAVVLWDVIRSDEAASHLYRQDSAHNLFHKSTSLYQSVFRLHGVTDSGFKQSFRYYQSHPEAMKIVLDSVDVLAKRPVLTTSKKAVAK
jgi:hypothetical protein